MNFQPSLYFCFINSKAAARISSISLSIFFTDFTALPFGTDISCSAAAKLIAKQQPQSDNMDINKGLLLPNLFIHLLHLQHVRELLHVIGGRPVFNEGKVTRYLGVHRAAIQTQAIIHPHCAEVSGGVKKISLRWGVSQHVAPQSLKQ